MKSTNIHAENYAVSRKERAQLMNHKSFVVWFTGLSGSGKSTIANHLEKELHKLNVHTYSLDGDNLRFGLCKDLGFSQEDRTENIRRIGEIANLMCDAGLIVLASFISPFEKDRSLVKQVVGDENFIEIFISTPLDECEKRDPKGLYAKARTGEINTFTGINSPYEEPKKPALSINTTVISIADAVAMILQLIKEKL